jgi:hypothetical protein
MPVNVRVGACHLHGARIDDTACETKRTHRYTQANVCVQHACFAAPHRTAILVTPQHCTRACAHNLQSLQHHPICACMHASWHACKRTLHCETEPCEEVTRPSQGRPDHPRQRTAHQRSPCQRTRRSCCLGRQSDTKRCLRHRRIRRTAGQERTFVCDLECTCVSTRTPASQRVGWRGEPVDGQARAKTTTQTPKTGPQTHPHPHPPTHTHIPSPSHLMDEKARDAMLRRHVAYVRLPPYGVGPRAPKWSSCRHDHCVESRDCGTADVTHLERRFLRQ